MVERMTRATRCASEVRSPRSRDGVPPEVRGVCPGSHRASGEIRTGACRSGTSDRQSGAALPRAARAVERSQRGPRPVGSQAIGAARSHSVSSRRLAGPHPHLQRRCQAEHVRPRHARVSRHRRATSELVCGDWFGRLAPSSSLDRSIPRPGLHGGRPGVGKDFPWLESRTTSPAFDLRSRGGSSSAAERRLRRVQPLRSGSAVGAGRSVDRDPLL